MTQIPMVAVANMHQLCGQGGLPGGGSLLIRVGLGKPGGGRERLGGAVPEAKLREQAWGALRLHPLRGASVLGGPPQPGVGL